MKTDAPPQPAARGRVLLPLGAFVFYAAITAAFVLATSAPIRTQFIGDGGDNWVFVWNSWWVKQCIVDLRNPYFCPFQFAPLGIPMTMHSLTLVPTLLIVAADAFLPMPLAYNVAILAFLPLAGLTAFGLARYVIRDAIAALLGGAVFMLCPFFSSRTLGHFNLMGAAFLPLYFLCLLRALDAPGRAPRALLALVFAVIVFSNEHTLIFAANLTVWLWLFRAWRSGQWRTETILFWQTLRPTALFALAWAGVLLYYAVRHGAVPIRSGTCCPEPLNFLLPLFPTSIWREYVAPPGPLGWKMTSLEMAVYLGWTVLPLAILGYRGMRSQPLVKFMGSAFVCALILSLGPKLHWHGEPLRVFGHSIPLPMKIYRFVPILGVIGQAGRYMIIGYLAMSVAVAGLIRCVRVRWGTTAALICTAGCLALVGLDYGYRLVCVPVPTCPIAPGPGRVMDVRELPSLGLYFQTLHHRDMVGGYISRWPVGIFEKYRSTPGVGWFFTPPKQRGAPPGGEELRSGLRALNVEYVCADRGGVERAVLDDAGLELVYEDELGVTFRLPP